MRMHKTPSFPIAYDYLSESLIHYLEEIFKISPNIERLVLLSPNLTDMDWKFIQDLVARTEEFAGSDKRLTAARMMFGVDSYHYFEDSPYCKYSVELLNYIGEDYYDCYSIRKLSLLQALSLLDGSDHPTLSLHLYGMRQLDCGIAQKVAVRDVTDTSNSILDREVLKKLVKWWREQGTPFMSDTAHVLYAVAKGKSLDRVFPNARKQTLLKLRMEITTRLIMGKTQRKTFFIDNAYDDFCEVIGSTWTHTLYLDAVAELTRMINRFE